MVDHDWRITFHRRSSACSNQNKQWNYGTNLSSKAFSLFSVECVASLARLKGL